MTIPREFRFQDPNRYPQDNIEDFEWWLSRHMPDTVGEFTYLPITWTAYYKKHKYGADKSAIAYLQHWLEMNLEKGRKYSTTIQYDDGILNDLSAYDVKVFAMGSPGDYQLPLICQPHNYNYYRMKKDIFCSFVGRITHPIRQAIVDQLSGKEGYYISTQPHKLAQFCEILARSKYVLCPRGYGLTSFRICEALQFNAVPVYLSDKFLFPHSLASLPTIPEGMMADIAARIESIPEMDTAGLYQQYFTYQSNKDLIIKALS